MVEFAVVAPVLVMLILYATFFQDAMKIKMKTQEAAHFGTWEFTSFPLSDYTAVHDHARLFTDAKDKIQADLIAKYSHFDSANPTAPNVSFISLKTLEVADGKLSLTNGKTPLVSSKTLNEIPSVGGAIGGILGDVLGDGLDVIGPAAFGFNMDGMVTTLVTSRFQNAILPRAFLDDRFNVPMVSHLLGDFEMTDAVSMVVDPWTLFDGRDAALQRADLPSDATIEVAQAEQHPVSTQVNRMKFLGLESKIVPSGVITAIKQVDKFLGNLDFPDPTLSTGSPVAMLNYARSPPSPSFSQYGCSSSSSPAKSGDIDLYLNGRDIDLGQHCFETAPFRLTFSYANSTPVQVFNESNKFFMGCVEPQAPEDQPAVCHR